MFHLRESWHAEHMFWTFPIELTQDEEAVVRVVKTRSKFYVFLRVIRHLLFNEAFLLELEKMYCSTCDDPQQAAA